MLFIGVDDARDERVPHDVLSEKFGKRNAAHCGEDRARFDEPALLPAREVDLGDVAGDDGGGATAQARVDPKEVAAARKAAAVEKTADAVAKTPANAVKAGTDSDKAGGGAITAKDAMKMSYKDFSALDEATLARMRGDVI